MLKLVYLIGEHQLSSHWEDNFRGKKDRNKYGLIGQNVVRVGCSMRLPRQRCLGVIANPSAQTQKILKI